MRLDSQQDVKDPDSFSFDYDDLSPIDQWIAQNPYRGDAMIGDVPQYEGEIPSSVLEKQKAWNIANESGVTLEDVDPLTNRLYAAPGTLGELRNGTVIPEMAADLDAMNGFEYGSLEESLANHMAGVQAMITEKAQERPAGFDLMPPASQQAWLANQEKELEALWNSSYKEWEDNVQKPFIDQAEKINADVKNQNGYIDDLINSISRVATPESVEAALGGETIDFTKLKLKASPGVYRVGRGEGIKVNYANPTINIPGFGETNQVKLTMNDFFQGSRALPEGGLFKPVMGEVRGIINIDDETKTAEIGDREGIVGAELTPEGEMWMKINVDPVVNDIIKGQIDENFGGALQRVYRDLRLSIKHQTWPLAARNREGEQPGLGSGYDSGYKTTAERTRARTSANYREMQEIARIGAIVAPDVPQGGGPSTWGDGHIGGFQDYLNYAEEIIGRVKDFQENLGSYRGGVSNVSEETTRAFLLERLVPGTDPEGVIASGAYKERAENSPSGLLTSYVDPNSQEFKDYKEKYGKEIDPAERQGMELLAKIAPGAWGSALMTMEDSQGTSVMPLFNIGGKEITYEEWLSIADGENPEATPFEMDGLEAYRQFAFNQILEDAARNMGTSDLQGLEEKIYFEMMEDSQGALAAMYFGNDGIKLWLDKDETVGDRNDRWEEITKSWDQGWIDFKGAIDAWDSNRTIEFTIIRGDGAFYDQKIRTPKEKKQAISEYWYRQYYRDTKIQSIEVTKNKIATNAEYLKKYGNTALINEYTATKDVAETMERMAKDYEFTEYILPGIRSAPTTLGTMAVGTVATLATGNPFIGAAAAGSFMFGTVYDKTFLDSYLDPSKDWMSEGQRKLYSGSVAGAEAIGEGLGYLFTLGGGRLLKLTGISSRLPAAMTRGAGSKYIGNVLRGELTLSERTAFQAFKDITIGGSTRLGVASFGEYVSEAGTGGLQYVAEQLATRRSIDGGELLDRMHHDGKIGFYMGLGLGSGSLTLETTAYGIANQLDPTSYIGQKIQASQRASAIASIIENGQLYGLRSSQQLRELRRAQTSLKELLEGRDISLTAEEKNSILNGKQSAALNLTEEEQKHMDTIRDLVSEATAFKGVDGSVYQLLMDQGRYDLIAEQIARDNLNQFYEWALSFDERGITIDENGAARTADGKLATGYGSRLDSILGKLSKEERQKYVEGKKDNDLQRRTLNSLARANYTRVLGLNIGNPNRGRLNEQMDTPSSGFVLMADAEGNVSEIDPAQLENMDSRRVGLVEVAGQFVSDAKGNVRVVVHTSRDSFVAATGNKDGVGAYFEATEEQRSEGRLVNGRLEKVQDEVHILMDESTSEGDVTRALVHELGHFKFQALVNDAKTRKELYNKIIEISQEKKSNGELANPFVASLVDVVTAEYKAAEYESVELEKEIINHFVQSLAAGLHTDEGMLNVFVDQIGRKHIRKSDAMAAVLDFAEYINKTAGEYASFSKSEFEQMKLHKQQEQQAQEMEFTEADEGVNEANPNNQEAMESRKFSKPFTYLQNTKLQYTLNEMDYSARGNLFPVQRTMTVTVKDYNHFRNLYAKLTGNGAAPGRMADIVYFKDGKAYKVNPPKPKLDRQTGEPIIMEVPEYKGWQKRQLEEMEAQVQGKLHLVRNLDALQRQFNESFNNSIVSKYANSEAFFPYETYSREEFNKMSAAEKAVIVEAALANLNAFFEMGLTVEEIESRAEQPGSPLRSPWLDVKKNLDIFNAANNKVETRAEKKAKLQEGVERHGVAPWQLMPKDSMAYERRRVNFALLSNEDLNYALQELKKLDSGRSTDGPLMPLQEIKIGSLDGSSKADKRRVSESHIGKDGLIKGVPEINQAKHLFDAVKKYVMQLDPTLSEGDALQAALVAIEKASFTTHNIDLTRDGVIEFKMSFKGVDGKTYTTAFRSNQRLADGTLRDVTGLAGGPRGAIGRPNEVHSNTSEQAQKEIITNARKVQQSDSTEHYVLLLRALTAENSFKNPLTSVILIDSMLQTIEEFGDVKVKDGSRTITVKQKVAEVLQQYMEKVHTAEEWKEIETKYLDGTDEVLDPSTFTKTIWENSYQYKINTNVPGLSQKNDMVQITEEGVVSFLTQLKEIAPTSGFGFGARGDFVARVLGPQVGLSKIGFVSKESFLESINDPLFSDAQAGDVVAASFVNMSTDADGNSLVKPVNVKDTVTKAKSKNISYEYGVEGSAGFYVLGVFLSPTEMGVEFTPRARMTPLAPLSGTQEGSLAAESRRLRGRIYVEGATSWEQSTATHYGNMIATLSRKFQDKYSDLLLLQQDIETFRNEKLPESQDFEMHMNLYYGKLRTDLELVENILDNVNRLSSKYGIQASDLSDFLYAMHARERNAHIAKQRPEILDGSGMSDETAEEILNEFDSPEMREVAAEAMKLVSLTRQYMVEGGLEKRSTIEAWEAQYEHYVPLNGLAEDEFDGETNSYPSGGAGMAIYGPSSRKARGRSSKTGVNILGSMAMQTAAVMQRARKDQAMLSLYRMAENNPNENVWSVHGPGNRLTVMGQELSDEAMRNRNDVVPLRINGRQHFIRFKNEGHAKALNGMTTEQLNFVTRLYGKYSTFLRNTYTVWNPAFFLPNFIRDVQSALFNAAAEIDREGGILEGMGLTATEFNKKLMLTTLEALGSLFAEASIGFIGFELSAKMQGYVEEWKAAGGRTGWSYSDTLNKVVSDLNDKSRGRTKAGAAMGKAWGMTVGGVASYVEGINEAFENSIRLAAYIEARKAGATKNRAAELSKNITVNFNKSGEVSSSINATYLFFNAAMQGVDRFGQTFMTQKRKVPKTENNPDGGGRRGITAAQKMGVGMVGISFAQTVFNILMSGRDDDDELYYKKDIPDYRKQRNLVMFTGKRDNVQLPLPYGINIFSNVGVTLAELSFGITEVDDAALFLAISANSSFNPIAFGHGDNVGAYAATTLSPTFIKPLVEVAMNETYFGTPIYREQYAFGTEVPEYTLSYRAPEWMVEINKALNEASGGKEFISGDYDFNPDPIYYLMQSMLGGSGKFFSETIDLGYTGYKVVENAINEMDDNTGFLEALEKTEKPKLRRSDVPILKIIYADPNRFYDFDLFEKNSKEVRQYRNQADKFEAGETGDVEGLNFTGIGNEEKGLIKELNDTESVLQDIRNLRVAVRNSDLNYIEKNNALYDLDVEESKTVVYFNAKYYELRGQYIDPRPTGLISEKELRKIFGVE